MKKRVLSALLVAAMTASALTGCSSTGEPAASDSTAADTTADSAVTTTESGDATASTGETDWPSKSAVTVNVPAKAGGGTDLQTRYITTAWTKTLGAALAVVNYDNAQVGMETVRNSAADGYQLLANHSGCLCQYQTGTSEINPVEDYEIVAAMQYMGDQAIIAAPDAPYDNMTELVEYAKENPGEVSCAIANGNSSQFIWGEIADVTGCEFKTVEAANETEKLTNIAGGFIDVGNVTLQNAIQYEEGGKVKVLGMLSKDGVDVEEVLARGDNWATLQSQGIDAPWGSNVYIFAPKGTDAATVAAINESLKPVIEDADYLEGMAAMGATAEWHTPEESKAMLEEEQALVEEIATSLGINAR